MIKLNLISPEQKKSLHYEFIYLAIRSVIWLVLIFIIIISAIFLSSRIMLEDNYSTLVFETTLVNQRNQGIDSEIAQINAALKELSSVQKDFIKWSAFLVNFTQAIPSNITISSLAIEKETKSLNLTGVALTRDDFLKLEKNLYQLPYLTNVSRPITNLLLKKNVEFQFTATINYDKLP
ncbi:MAG: hypothetical protein V1712_03590 [Patescibacteria group bacterium]